MPLTEKGKKVLKKLIEYYGEEKGKNIFYALINLKRKGSEKWHKKKKEL